MKNQITQCPACLCMTKTIGSKCGKCGRIKDQWKEALVKDVDNLECQLDIENHNDGECCLEYNKETIKELIIKARLNGFGEGMKHLGKISREVRQETTEDFLKERKIIKDTWSEKEVYYAKGWNGCLDRIKEDAELKNLLT